MTTITEEQPPPSIWTAAQQRCWSHVETATQMMKTLEALQGLHVTSVIPILSDTQPTLMVTPEGADDLISVKAVCRYIKSALLTSEEWLKLPINECWVLRLKASNVTVDLMTRLPCVVETKIDV